VRPGARSSSPEQAASSRGALGGDVPPAVALIGLYLLLYVVLDSLRFPIRGDEAHYWRNTLRFAQTLFPPIELLRDYGELNTPLPFMIWGALEYLFGQGIWLARFTNFLTSFVILLLVIRSRPGTGEWRPYAAAGGVLICPYYLFVSAHAYTDIIPTCLVLIGVVLHCDRRYVLGAVAFVLAIAGRQYMLAFPAALVAFELLDPRGRKSDPVRYLAPAVACASIVGWYLFFGGVGPSGEAVRQRIVTIEPERLIPRNSVYLMACIGFYYGIPSLVLRRDRLKEEVTGLGAVMLAVLLLALFLLDPPIQNQNFGIPSMGALDRIVRGATGDLGRAIVFFLLAVTAALRVRESLLPALLLASNAVLMMKAHIAWDKYALPLIVVLWYLEGSGKWNGRREERHP